MVNSHIMISCVAYRIPRLVCQTFHIPPPPTNSPWTFKNALKDVYIQPHLEGYFGTPMAGFPHYMENLENLNFILYSSTFRKGLEFAQKHEELGILKTKPGIFKFQWFRIIVKKKKIHSIYQQLLQNGNATPFIWPEQLPF